MFTQSPGRSHDSTHTIIASLTAIVGNAQLLERKLSRGESVPLDLVIQTLKSIQREGHRAAAAVRQENDGHHLEKSTER
jgi:hypothetical protein